MKYALAVIGLCLAGVCYAETNCWEASENVWASAGGCECGCVTTGNCVCPNCNNPVKGNAVLPACKCGCEQTGQCICKNCDQHVRLPIAKKIIPPIVPVDPTPNPIAYEWRRSSDGTYAGLYKNGVQIGAYRFADDAYRELNGDKWGEFKKPPIEVPPLLLANFKETCGGASSQSSAALSYQFAPEGLALTEVDASSYQSGSSGGSSSNSRGAFMQRGPLRRLLARIMGR